MPEEKKDPYAIWDRIRGKFTEKQLYSALRNYTGRSSTTYDPEFDRKIRELKPGWFRDPDGVANKKAELLAMAARGEGRPAVHGKNKHPLGRLLSSYTCLKSKMYDPVFDQQIRQAAPGWFLDKVDVKKAELLAMAARGEGRPVQGTHPLGRDLCEYTNSKSKMYDPVFDQQIRTAAPHWFLDKVALNKQELLAKAARGEGRPTSGKHPLGQVIGIYTNSKSKRGYDPVFDQQIRHAAPHWFLDTAAMNKQELLAMAARGEGRPAATGKNKHSLGKVLCHYIDSRSKMYDPVFDQAIRAAAPHWFLDTAAMNKQELLAMAARGEGRPVQRKHPLGEALCRYTCSKPHTYDPVFDQQIRQAAPHWFERSNKLRTARTPTKKGKT